MPAIIDQETFDAAQARLQNNKALTRRNNKRHDYLLRGLVSCGQCRLSSTGRTCGKYQYYKCRGRTDSLRAAKGERCTARYHDPVGRDKGVPARQLDELVWGDLCAVLADPTLITHELERARAGEWLPQALQAHRKTVRQALARLERQQERLLEVYLAETIARDEFERKHQELNQMRDGLTQQLRQLNLQAQRQVDLLGLAKNIEAFCQRIHPTLDSLDFSQRRQLVELLVDRVIVDDDKVEIRYVIPTSPSGENSRFCHLRTDYFNPHSPAITAQDKLRVGQVGCQQPGYLFAGAPVGQQVGVIGILGCQATIRQPGALSRFTDQAVEALRLVHAFGLDQIATFLTQNITTLSGATRVSPAPRFELFLERNLAKFSVADKGDRRPRRQQTAHVGQQSDLLFGRGVSPGVLYPGPCQRDCATPIGNRHHQQLMSETYLAPIYHQMHHTARQAIQYPARNWSAQSSPVPNELGRYVDCTGYHVRTWIAGLSTSPRPRDGGKRLNRRARLGKQLNPGIFAATLLRCTACAE